MALKRKDIRAIIGDESLSDEEKCAKIIAGHIETVDGLNDTITSLKTENEKLNSVSGERRENCQCTGEVSGYLYAQWTGGAESLRLGTGDVPNFAQNRRTLIRA